MERGYSDNRWLTYNQMKEKGWDFKRDEEGNSMGKKAGVSIEYFSLYDKQTKQAFDRNTLDGLTEAERDDYMDENVSMKVVRIIQGYVNVVNKMVWRKTDE